MKGDKQMKLIKLEEIRSNDEKYSNKSVKRTWSEWEPAMIYFRDVNGHPIRGQYYYRSNGKKVQVKVPLEHVGHGTIKAEASCCNDDIFDFKKGLELAKRRLIVKILDEHVKTIAKRM